MSKWTQPCQIPGSEESGPNLEVVCGLLSSRPGEAVRWRSVVEGEARGGHLSYLV